MALNIFQYYMPIWAIFRLNETMSSYLTGSIHHLVVIDIKDYPWVFQFSQLYQRAMSYMFSDIDGVEVTVDDLLGHAPTKKLHNKRLRQVFQRCRERNLRLNPKKIKLCADQVTYVDQTLTGTGDEKVKAVLEMPEPTSIKKCVYFTRHGYLNIKNQLSHIH